MSKRAAAILSWGGAVIVVLATAATIVLSFLVSLPATTAFADMLNGLISGLVGALIAARRPQNPIGWSVLVIGLCISVNSFNDAYFALVLPYGLERAPGALFLAWLSGLLWVVLFMQLTVLLHLFPTGHTLNRRWRMIFRVAILAQIGMLLFFAVVTPLTVETQDGSTLEYPNPIGLVYLPIETSGPALFIVFMLVPIVLGLVALLVRFATARGVEREQIKWLLYAASLFVITIVLELGQVIALADSMAGIMALGMPIAIGIALLRYRLYDIDIIIRKTLTYALVVALLAMLYFGSVILLQQLFASITNLQDSTIITVVSTLAIAALFVPLRNKIQALIDRRFYRKKYDAQQVLQDFAQTVRDETDLEKLTARLIEVVNETMQPKSVSVWLKTEGGKVKDEG